MQNSRYQWLLSDEELPIVAEFVLIYSSACHSHISRSSVSRASRLKSKPLGQQRLYLHQCLRCPYPAQ